MRMKESFVATSSSSGRTTVDEQVRWDLRYLEQRAQIQRGSETHEYENEEDA